VFLLTPWDDLRGESKNEKIFHIYCFSRRQSGLEPGGWWRSVKPLAEK